MKRVDAVLVMARHMEVIVRLSGMDLERIRGRVPCATAAERLTRSAHRAGWLASAKERRLTGYADRPWGVRISVSRPPVERLNDYVRRCCVRIVAARVISAYSVMDLSALTATQHRSERIPWRHSWKGRMQMSEEHWTDELIRRVAVTNDGNWCSPNGLKALACLNEFPCDPDAQADFVGLVMDELERLRGENAELRERLAAEDPGVIRLSKGGQSE